MFENDSSPNSPWYCCIASLPIVSRLGALLLFSFTTLACGDDNHYRGYWDNTPVTPVFSLKHNEISTSFSGFVHPNKHFLFGAAEGLTFDKPKIKLTVLANAVWAYEPIHVHLYDGPRETVGKPEARVAEWVVLNPDLNAALEFSISTPLPNGRIPTWAVIDFKDYAGTTNFQILGHD